MKLLNGYILIKVDEEKTQTETGIYLSNDSVKIPSTGEVVAVAPEVKLVKPGDRVEFLRYAAVDASEEGHRLCKIEQIIGIH
jgi:co-chaperonin GroES (HSP10)